MVDELNVKKRKPFKNLLDRFVSSQRERLRRALGENKEVESEEWLAERPDFLDLTVGGLKSLLRNIVDEDLTIGGFMKDLPENAVNEDLTVGGFIKDLSENAVNDPENLIY